MRKARDCVRKRLRAQVADVRRTGEESSASRPSAASRSRYSRAAHNSRQHSPSPLTDRHGLQMVMAPVLLLVSRTVRRVGVRSPYNRR